MMRSETSVVVHTQQHLAAVASFLHSAGPRCYFDISIGNRYAGRIVFGLYSDVARSLDKA